MSIKKIIDDWDPIELLPYAPKDEYDKEIELIENYIFNFNIQDESVLADEIHKIFSRRFGDIFTSDFEKCLEVAKKCLENLDRR